jgi:hypothetical protein
LEITTLLEVTAKENNVANILFSAQIDPRIHGIEADQDVEKREIANLVLSNKANLDAVYFVLPNGDMYLVEPYQYQLDLASTNFAFRDWYKGVMSTESTYVSELFYAQGKKEYTVAITTPVKSESGELVGIWGGLVNLDFWNKQFAEIDLAKNEHIVIVDHNGNVVTTNTRQLPINTMESSDYMQSVNNALAGNNGNAIETINGVNFFVIYVPVTVGPHTWALIITEPYEDTFSSVKLIRLQYISIAIAMSGVTIVALYLLKGSTRNLWRFSQIEQIEENVPEIPSPVEGKSSRKSYIAIISLSMILIGVIFLVQAQHTSETIASVKSLFVIQNLRGDTIDTWINWKIPKDDTFHIHIVDSHEVTTQRMQIISDAIYSKESVVIDDLLLHKGPAGSTSTYYKGWLGAIESVSDTETKFALPIHFHSIVTDMGEGHIVIRLSELQNADGYSAYTKSIVDEENHQILKSVITVYEIDKLSDDQLATIVRHELGHGLGLAHSTAPEDLMAPIITTPHPYISECDISALVDLYDGKQNSQVICEK